MQNMPLVPPIAVTELVSASEKYTLVDVREQDEWDAGHAPDALHIPMSQIVERVAELPEGKLALVCRSGARSARVTAWLRQFGYDAVNVDGGMGAWMLAGLPLVREGDEVPDSH